MTSERMQLLEERERAVERAAQRVMTHAHAVLHTVCGGNEEDMRLAYLSVAEKCSQSARLSLWSERAVNGLGFGG